MTREDTSSQSQYLKRAAAGAAGLFLLVLGTFFLVRALPDGWRDVGAAVRLVLLLVLIGFMVTRVLRVLNDSEKGDRGDREGQ